ncbi:unnamed protein product [Clavelina lepadiformis]|uniref:Uncharacterized protein n=1 Tax=Clavelina lepadiformis TaxID=159417 RepID=A0ABP0FMY9_CLALP
MGGGVLRGIERVHSNQVFDELDSFGFKMTKAARAPLTQLQCIVAYQSSLYEKCCRLAYTTQQCSTSEPDAEECNQNARSLSSLVRTDDESGVGDWDGGREKRAAALTIS